LGFPGAWVKHSPPKRLRKSVRSGRGGLECVVHGGTHQFLVKRLSVEVCEFDQMREVLFVREADDLALATSHLAQSSSASRFTAGASELFILSQSRSGPSGKATVSAPRCVGCKRVIRTAGIHKIRTRGAQHFFDLLDRLPNHTARLAA